MTHEPHRIHAMAMSPVGASYRGKAGCRDVRCTRRWEDGKMSSSCYGWHCLYCDGPSNCQGDCSNADCPAKSSAPPTTQRTP